MYKRLEKLEKQAISFIKTVERNSDKPLFAGMSGGKDSGVVDFLLQKSGINYTSYYTNTTIDPQGNIKFIKHNFPHTVILRPKETFMQLVERKGLPTRLNRYCCEHLKEYGSVGKMVFEGVRSEESTKRQGRDYIQCDNRSWQKGAKHIYPIYDWKLKDVLDYHKLRNIPMNPNYERGFNRIGCVGCPLVSRKGVRKREFDLYPKLLIAIQRAIQKGMDKNPQWKLTVACNGNSQKAIDWWLTGKTMNEYFTDYKIEKLTDEKGKKIGWKRLDRMFKQASLF